MVILGDKGLKFIRLSINGKNFYENSYRLGGAMAPPGPPTKSAPGVDMISCSSLYCICSIVEYFVSSVVSILYL